MITYRYARHVTVDPNCLFCRIITGEMSADMVRETDRTVAFRDINPHAPLHVLVMPRAHYPNVEELAKADPELAGTVLAECAAVARHEGVSDYRIVFNTGPEAGQSIFHVHAHVLGGRGLGTLTG
jgi:histidine triad (HIT) family protein